MSRSIVANISDLGTGSKNATSTLCSAPIRDDTRAVSYAGVIGGVLALIAYIMRMVSRMPRFGGSLGWDDAVITIAMLEIIPLTVFSVIRESLPSFAERLSI